MNIIQCEGRPNLQEVLAIDIMEETTSDGAKYFGILLWYMDRIALFDVYTTRQKAERYHTDLLVKWSQLKGQI